MDPMVKETITVERREAELGVEVAEIPKHYLVDNLAGNNTRGTQENKRPPPFTKERFQNKRRRRDHRKDRNKKQRCQETTLDRAPTMQKSQPSLLKKLLVKDIQRDKVRLLQVFRFMFTNSYFKDWREQTLKFPVFTVNGEVCGRKATPSDNTDDKTNCADNDLLVEEEEAEITD